MDVAAIVLFTAFTAALGSCIYQFGYYRGHRDGRRIEDFRDLFEKVYHDDD